MKIIEDFCFLLALDVVLPFKTKELMGCYCSMFRYCLTGSLGEKGSHKNSEHPTFCWLKVVLGPHSFVSD